VVVENEIGCEKEGEWRMWGSLLGNEVEKDKKNQNHK
jgi:hypothetical protein